MGGISGQWLESTVVAVFIFPVLFIPCIIDLVVMILKDRVIMCINNKYSFVWISVKNLCEITIFIGKIQISSRFLQLAKYLVSPIKSIRHTRYCSKCVSNRFGKCIFNAYHNTSIGSPNLINYIIAKAVILKNYIQSLVGVISPYHKTPFIVDIRNNFCHTICSTFI